MKENLNDINNDLLVKYLLGEATGEEVVLVQRWLAESDDNSHYFEQFTLIWEESKGLAHRQDADETTAWLRFKDRINKPSTLVALPSAPVRRMNWLRVAAAFILLAGGAVLAYALLFRQQVEMLAVRASEATVTDTLPDGSVITLNKHSVVRYPSRFTGDNRSISLEGEAFFTITPDKSKPFIIHVQDVTVSVVGTSFNIRTDRGSTEVVVETGIVEVQRQNKSLRLHPKEKVNVRKADSALVKQPVTENLYQYYRPRTFNCENTPLWKLVEALNEAYGVQIVIGRNELRAMPITTVFDDEPLDHILTIISQTFGTKVVRAGNEIILQ